VKILAVIFINEALVHILGGLLDDAVIHCIADDIGVGIPIGATLPAVIILVIYLIHTGPQKKHRPIAWKRRELERLNELGVILQNKDVWESLFAGDFDNVDMTGGASVDGILIGNGVIELEGNLLGFELLGDFLSAVGTGC
jgi:hypothetical protein